MTNPPIVPVLEALGFSGLIEYGGWRAVKCEFHGDRHASASYNADEGVYNCFVCDIKGDAYAVIMKTEGAGFVEAKQRVLELTGVDGGKLSGSPKPASSRLPAWTRDKSRGSKLLSSGKRRRFSS